MCSSDLLEIALITLAGLMGDGEFEESETIKYLQRVLEDDGDYSVED